MVTFYFLIIVLAIVIWFLFSFAFPVIGLFIKSIIQDAKTNINKDFGRKGEKDDE